MPIAHWKDAPIQSLTVTKAAAWIGRELVYRLTTSTGEPLPLWLEKAIGQNAPDGLVEVRIYPGGARLYHPAARWLHDVGKPGRRP